MMELAWHNARCAAGSQGAQRAQEALPRVRGAASRSSRSVTCAMRGAMLQAHGYHQQAPLCACMGAIGAVRGPGARYGACCGRSHGARCTQQVPFAFAQARQRSCKAPRRRPLLHRRSGGRAWRSLRSPACVARRCSWRAQCTSMLEFARSPAAMCHMCSARQKH
jgi:hypothetical protein